MLRAGVGPWRTLPLGHFALGSRPSACEPPLGSLTSGAVPAVTIIGEDVRNIDADIDNGRVLVDAASLPDAIGWELKPEGLCRDDVCVPVRDRSALLVDDRVDLASAAAALGRPAVIDGDARLISIAIAAEQRRQALDALVAPSFELADLDGTVHQLEEWRGRKKLLVAFASW